MDTIFKNWHSFALKFAPLWLILTEHPEYFVYPHQTHIFYVKGAFEQQFG